MDVAGNSGLFLKHPQHAAPCPSALQHCSAMSLKVLSLCQLGRCQIPVTQSCNREPARGEGLLVVPSLLPAPHPASSSRCTSRAVFPSSRFLRSSELALEALRALLTTASTCATESLWLQGQGHPERGYQDWPPSKGVPPLHPCLGWQPLLPVQVLPLGQSPSLQCPVAPVRGLLWDFLGNLLGKKTAALRRQDPWTLPAQHHQEHPPKGWSKENISS